MTTTKPARWSAARSSMHSTLSHLWHSRYPAPVAGSTVERSDACEVPIYLSETCENIARESAGRSPRSTRSIIETASNFVSRIRPLTLRTSSVYSASSGSRHPTHVKEATKEDCHGSQLFDHDLESADTHVAHTTGGTKSEEHVLSSKRPRPRRNGPSLRVKIESKRKLSMAFGVTILAALVICRLNTSQLLKMLTAE